VGTFKDLWKIPMTARLQESKRRELVSQFPVLRGCPHESYLSLAKYLREIPERFYCRESFEKFWGFLSTEMQSNQIQLLTILDNRQHEIDRAFLILSTINREHWHEHPADTDEYNRIRFIDRTINPAYLTLIEGVYVHFVYLIAASSRLNRGKPLDKLDVFNCVEEIRLTTHSAFGHPYNNTVRNSVAHGGTTYRENETIYQDKKGNTHSLTHHEMIRLTDTLLDLCNACALALKLFYILNLNTGINVPRQLMMEELQSEAEAPWWHIEGFVLSETGSQSQLVIYATPNTRDYWKVLHSAFLSGALCEQFSPGFDRYFFSLRSGIAYPGWAGFDGNKLREAREKGSITYDDYRGVLEGNRLFFAPKMKVPQLLCRIETYLYIFQILWPITMAEARLRAGQSLVMPRSSAIHKNGWRSVLRGSVVIRFPENIDVQQVIRKSCRRIIRSVLKKARKEANLCNPAKFLPLGFARIGVYKTDHRCRELEGYGLGPELICTVQISRIKRIQAPDIYQSSIETKGKYRIAWNKAWLDSMKEGENC